MALNTQEYVAGTAGASSTLTGDQVVAEVQQILESDGFGVHASFARPNRQNGSLFTYKTPERMIPQAYDKTTSGKVSIGGKVPQVNILADKED